MDRMAEPQQVAEQYRDESRLQTRRSVWRDSVDGRNPQDTAAAAVRAARPRRILEVGCGTGAFAARLASENPDATLIATDQSERFVEMTSARGVRAQVADVQQLPFPDAGFDVVVAMWMLYHVPDLDQGLRELRRVLRPGGRLVAVTNGEAHTAALRTDAGGTPAVTQFSVENGADVLRRHFAAVTQEDISTRAVFESHEQAVAYLASFDADLAANLPYFEGPREDAGSTTVFVAF
jgi:ubiquinone/menaquinone biosynthesis C-methylase UbiE